MSNPIDRSSKILKQNPGDEIIKEMIKRRNLQQGALMKIMTSIDFNKNTKSVKGKKKSSTNNKPKTK